MTLLRHVECELEHFGDQNHCKAFILELEAAYARARRRAAKRAGLTDAEADAGSGIVPISVRTYAAPFGGMHRSPDICQPCRPPNPPEDAPGPPRSPDTADGGYEEQKS